MKKKWSEGKTAAVILGGAAAAMVLGISLIVSLYQMSDFMERLDRRLEDRRAAMEIPPEDTPEKIIGKEEEPEENTPGNDIFGEEEEYYDFANDIHSGLDYEIEFRTYTKDDFLSGEREGSARVEFSYPLLSGNVKNLDGINEALQKEIETVEEYVASSAVYLAEGEEYSFEAEGYVTYMSDELLSVIYVEYGYMDGSFFESYIVSYNVDMETGMVLNNSQLLDINDSFSVDFRERCEKQNGEVEELYYMSDQEITYYLTDNDYLIAFYTPLGMEIGFNFYEGWVTVTYKDYQKYRNNF